MMDRRWRMTKTGLECVDCAGLDLTQGRTGSRDEQIQTKVKNQVDSAMNADTMKK
jgi:hypothetical protein